MLIAEVVPAERARYAASLVFVPGLWSGAPGWRRGATYLAHRGWECHLVDPRGCGGVEGRAAAVAQYVASLQVPPVLIGHDAGALVGIAAAGVVPTAAVVLVAPLVPGSREALALLPRLRTLLGVLFGRPLTLPTGAAARLLWAGLADSLQRQVAAGGAGEDTTLLRDLTRPRALPVRPPRMPVLLLGGGLDPLLPVPAARVLAARLVAEHETLGGAGHWPHVTPTTWQLTFDLLHRWLVQRLGEPLLERYAEAMAERDADDE